eukprot:761795-Hanusia_phi.AAC.4
MEQRKGDSMSRRKDQEAERARRREEEQEGGGRRDDKCGGRAIRKSIAPVSLDLVNRLQEASTLARIAAVKEKIFRDPSDMASWMNLASYAKSRADFISFERCFMVFVRLLSGWSTMSVDEKELCELVAQRPGALEPSVAVRLGLHPEHQLKVALSRVCVAKLSWRNRSTVLFNPSKPQHILHLAYLSADFKDHKAYHLRQSLFRDFDRSRFALSLFDASRHHEPHQVRDK